MDISKELISKVKIKPLTETLRLEDISDDDYFSEKYSDYISNSRLGKLKTEGAEAFFNKMKSTYTPSFELGTLVHQQVLQPELFYVVPNVYRPTAKAGLMADFLYKEDGTNPTDDNIKAASYEIGYYKDKLTSTRLNEFRQKAEPYWRDRFVYEQSEHPEEDGRLRVYTDEKSYGILTNCLSSLNNDSNIQRLLHPIGITEDPYIANERTILMDIEASSDEGETVIYKLKAKLDNFTIDKEENTIVVNDLKTCSKPIDMFDPTFFSYQREIAFYSWLLKLCAKEFFDLPNPEVSGNFLVVSTIPEYKTCVYPMTQKLYKSGWAEVSYLLKTVYILNTQQGFKFA